MRATESELVLADDTILNWIFKFFGLLLAVTAVSLAYDAWEGADYFSEAVGGYLGALAILILGVAIWQFYDRTTTVVFNRPKGYLTVKRCPWWSILIPAGPRFIRTPTLVPLPRDKPYVLDRSGTTTFPARTGPDQVEIRQMYIRRFDVHVPLDGGRIFPLWTTLYESTYVEIIRRLNRAMEECGLVAPAGAGARSGAAVDEGLHPEAVGAVPAKCPKCERQLPAGSRFCPYDGTPVARDCPHCGHPAPPDARFCIRCGAAL